MVVILAQNRVGWCMSSRNLENVAEEQPKVREVEIWSGRRELEAPKEKKKKKKTYNLR